METTVFGTTWFLSTSTVIKRVSLRA